MKSSTVPVVITLSSALSCLFIVFAVIALLLSGGCVTDSRSTLLTPSWPDAPSSEWAAIWSEEVQIALDDWQNAIGDDCVFPLTIGAGGAAVTLYSPKAWPHGPVRGVYASNSGEIRIVGDQARGHFGALVHELGHAIGLDHTDDVTSVMYHQEGATKSVTANDAKLARAALGCY